jgi:primosomal replication protein N
MKSKLEDVILGKESARNEMMNRRKGWFSNKLAFSLLMLIKILAERNPAPAGGGGEKLRWRKDVLTWKSSNNEANERPKAELEMDAHIEGNLNTELGLVMLDTLENIVQVG